MSTAYPTDDDDTLSLVRSLTMYDDSEDEIPERILRSQLRLGKMRLTTQTGSSDFYTDDALGQALVGTTAILAKSAIENYSITSWNLGVGEIDVSEAADADQVQFQQWATMVSEALADGGYATNTATNINSSSYIN